MQVLVVGAGKVGFEIADRLAAEGHDIVVIDKNPLQLQEVAAHLDVMTIVGNGANPAVLEQANVQDCDLMIAVTEIDEVNMIACMAAKQYGVDTCVARIRNPEYTADHRRSLPLSRLGVDLAIDPERLAAEEITRLIRIPLTTEVESFAGGRISIIGLKVDPDAPIIGKPLSETRLPHLLIAALIRDDDVIIPKGSDSIQAADQIFVIGRTESFHAARPLLFGPSLRIRRVAILGAGRIGVSLAQSLSAKGKHRLDVIVIERDAEQASQAAQSLPHALVIHGDGTKIDVLREEGIDEVDAFVAVSGEDHTNLLSTMLAKQLGVKEVITEISRADYVPLAQKAGADAVVVPRLLAASAILRFVRPSQVLSMMMLEEGRVEALVMEPTPDAPVVDRPLREIRFPDGAIVGAILHSAGHAAAEPEIARGDTIIRAGDQVVVFSLPEVVGKVNRFFGGSGQLPQRSKRLDA